MEGTEGSHVVAHGSMGIGENGRLSISVVVTSAGLVINDRHNLPHQHCFHVTLVSPHFFSLSRQSSVDDW